MAEQDAVATHRYEELQINYPQIMVMFAATQFVCWLLLEVLERKMGMQPAIRKRTSLTKLPHFESEDSQQRRLRTQTKLRMTKRLDKKGRFRIQTRGSLYFVKAIWMFVGVLFSVVMLIQRPEWYKRHFYELNTSSTNVQLYPLSTAMIASYYTFEMATNRYAKLQWSILIHHWVSVAAATAVLCGSFSPLLTWYAIVGIFTAGIPLNFALGFRANWSYKFSHFTRSLLRFAAYWYLVHVLLIFGGATLISLNMWRNGFYSNSWEYVRFAYTVCAALAFGYNDILTLRALFDLSRMDYQHARIDHREPSRSKTRTKTNREPPQKIVPVVKSTLHKYTYAPQQPEWTETARTAMLDEHEQEADDSEWELEAWPINHSPQSGFSVNLPPDLFLSDDELQLDARDHEHIAYVSQMAAGLTYVAYDDVDVDHDAYPTPRSMRSLWTQNTEPEMTAMDVSSPTIIRHKSVPPQSTKTVRIVPPAQELDAATTPSLMLRSSGSNTNRMNFNELLQPPFIQLSADTSTMSNNRLTANALGWNVTTRGNRADSLDVPRVNKYAHSNTSDLPRYANDGRSASVTTQQQPVPHVHHDQFSLSFSASTAAFIPFNSAPTYFAKQKSASPPPANPDVDDHKNEELSKPSTIREDQEMTPKLELHVTTTASAHSPTENEPESSMQDRNDENLLSVKTKKNKRMNSQSDTKMLNAMWNEMNQDAILEDKDTVYLGVHTGFSEDEDRSRSGSPFPAEGEKKSANAAKLYIDVSSNSVEMTPHKTSNHQLATNQPPITPVTPISKSDRSFADSPNKSEQQTPSSLKHIMFSPDTKITSPSSPNDEYIATGNTAKRKLRATASLKTIVSDRSEDDYFHPKNMELHRQSEKLRADVLNEESFSAEFEIQSDDEDGQNEQDTPVPVDRVATQEIHELDLNEYASADEQDDSHQDGNREHVHPALLAANSAPTRQSIVVDHAENPPKSMQFLHSENIHRLSPKSPIATRPRINSAPKRQSKLYGIDPPRRPSRSKSRSKDIVGVQHRNVYNKNTRVHFDADTKSANPLKRYGSAQNLDGDHLAVSSKKRRSFHVSSKSAMQPEVTFKSPISARNMNERLLAPTVSDRNIRNLGFVEVRNNVTGKKETLFVRKKKKQPKKRRVFQQHSAQIIMEDENNDHEDEQEEKEEQLLSEQELVEKQRRFPSYYKRVSKHRNYASEHVNITQRSTVPTRTDNNAQIVSLQKTQSSTAVRRSRDANMPVTPNDSQTQRVFLTPQNSEPLSLGEYEYNEKEAAEEKEKEKEIGDEMEVSMMSWNMAGVFESGSRRASESKSRSRIKYWQKIVVARLNDVFATDGRFDNDGIYVDFHD